MRIRWRGLELPSRVVRDETCSTDSYGRFTIEPFEQGFGTTIGNSLRRVLLSSLEGAAVTSVKIAGVSHEFTSIDGVLEDVTDILLNIKGIVLRVEGDLSTKISVQRTTPGEVRAGDVVSEPSVTVANPDHLIATLTAKVNFEVEMTVGKGRGYATGSENRSADQELGVISVDSVFSPVHRVRYRTEDMRVGQRTNYDRLILEIWANGTVLPEDALVEAGLILRKHLNPFVMYHDLGEQLVTPPKLSIEPAVSENAALAGLLEKPVSVLNLSVRASNCLEAAKITKLGDLAGRSEQELLRFRSFGKTSLHEVQRKLAEVGLSLGMDATEGGPVVGAEPEADGTPEEEGAEPASETTSDSASAEPGPMEAFTRGD